MSGETAILRVKIDPSGAVVGGKAVEGSVNGMSAAAGRANAAIISTNQRIKSMATAFAASAVTVTAVATVLGTFAKAAMEAEDNANRLASAVRRKGSAFAYSTDQLIEMASELEAVTRFEDDAIQKAQAVLLRFDEIDGSNIREITEATLDFAQATGQDAASAAVALGKALLEPGEGMRALKEIGVTLTEQQQSQIERWNELGESAKSVALLIGLVNEKIGGEAKASALTGAGGVDQLKNALGNLSETIGESLIPRTSKLTLLIRELDSALASDNGKRVTALWLAVTQASLFQFGMALENFKEAWNGTVAAVDVGSAKSAHGVKTMGDAFRSVAKLSEEDLKALRKAQDEAAQSANAFAAEYEALRDRLDPSGAAARQLAKDVDLLERAFARMKIPAEEQTFLIGKLSGNWSHAATLAADLNFELMKVASTWDRINDAIGSDGIKTQVAGDPSMKLSRPETWTDAERNADRFTTNLSEGMGAAVADFAREFAETGELNVRRLGDMLRDVLLSAAQEYFATMIANQAKLKADAGEAGGGNTAMLFAAGFLMVAKAIADSGNAKKATSYDEGAFFSRYYTAGMTGGDIRSDYTFRDSALEAGNTHDQDQMVQTVRAYMEAFRAATNGVVTDIGEFTMQIRHDGEAFQTTYRGVILGEFETIEDATLAGIQAAFKAGDFVGALDPVIEQMVANFKGKSTELLDAIQMVKGIQDEVSGLSDIELAIRDMPQTLENLEAKLKDVGVSAEDAAVLTAKFAATQYQNIRDQITGHQQSNAEMLAQKQREAAMFNAQLALDEAKVRAEMANLQNQATIEQAKVDVAQAGAQAQLTIINATLAAYGQVLAALESVAPIDIGEIRLPRVGGGGRPHGGGISSGPSESEQRATAFLDFLERLRLDRLSDYQRALADLNAAFAEQAQAASEVEGGEERLAAARRQALADLREDVIDALGSPMEAVRDRLAEIRQRVDDWRAANDALGEQFLNGEISLQQLLDALAESNTLWAEFGDMAQGELLNLAAYFADAMGNTEESARIRAELAEMEWDFKRLEMQMMIETYAELGLLSAAAADHWRDFVSSLPENLPGGGAGAAGGASGSGSLQQAINRLRNAIDGLRKSNENLLLSEVSPLSTADQFAEAERQYLETLALAQSGDIGAIEDFASVRDEYLALAAAMFGTSGAGYQSIFAQSLQAGQDLASAGQAILDAIPPQMAGVEDRLDTIAEIEAAILAALGGSPQNPPPPPGGGGPVDPPRPPGPPRPPRHDGDPDFPDDGPPRPAGRFRSAEAAQLRQVNENLLLLLEATEAHAREARNDRLTRLPSSGGGNRLTTRRGS